MLFKIKNLLPKWFSLWVAQNRKLPKIKLGFPKGFTMLTVAGFALFSLLGYYPAFAFPPVRQATVRAQSQVEKGEVIASTFLKAPILPHPGYLSTKFSTWHPAIDIAIGLGMPIHPVLVGEIVQSGWDFWGLGNFVEISHENGFKSKYAHMGRIYVRVGDKVNQENIIGEVGMTGNTSGPHTHLEITHNGNYIDPETILPEIPGMPQTAIATTK